MSITRSISSSVVSSKVFGMAVPALFTSTSSRPKVATVFSTASLTASTSAASAWIATAFPPPRSIALTTAEAALASFRVCDGHARSIRGQTFRDRCANAPRAAGNECHFFA